MRKTLLFLFLLSGAVCASDTQQMVLNYDGFFDRMESLDDPEFVDVKLAFYFTQRGKTNACPITSAKLKTELKSQDVYYFDSGEVVLPFDKQLDLDKAKLVIESKAGFDCGLNMRIESKQIFSDSMSKDQTQQLIHSFDVALDELGGMMSFLMPDVTGVKFLGNEQNSTTQLASNIGRCSENTCIVTLQELENSADTKLVFNVAPSKAVPHIQK